MRASRPITLRLARALGGGGVAMGFRRIPAGRFVMGSRGQYDWEEPPHQVQITRDYWMGETPVTQRQFAVWTQMEAIKHRNSFQNNDNHPAEDLVWDDAVAFCRWLTVQCLKAIPFGLVARLPTEAEWEMACRAGTDSDYWSGDGVGALDAVGWFQENSQGSTHPVRSKAANPFGLYDVHGNVWEWCADTWDERAYPKRADGICDPFTHLSGGDVDPDRVLRVGPWGNPAWFCRSACRTGGSPHDRTGRRSFRVCLGFPLPGLDGNERR